MYSLNIFKATNYDGEPSRRCPRQLFVQYPSPMLRAERISISSFETLVKSSNPKFRLKIMEKYFGRKKKSIKERYIS